MDRLFLDANVLFSAAYSDESGLHALWELRVVLLTSEYAAQEAFRNLHVERHRSLQSLLQKVQVQGTMPDASSQAEVLMEAGLPPKDQPILASAIAAGASHLLTGDKGHFGPLFGRSISGVRIVTPSMYFSARK